MRGQQTSHWATPRATVLAAVAALTLGLSAAPAPAQERAVPMDAQQVQLSFSSVVRAVAPAVVNIYSRRVLQARTSPLFDDPFFRRFFGEGFAPGMPRQRMENSLGSGVVVAPEGVIVTNHHVVAAADEIIVVLADRRELEATLIGSDERTDLAVLRVDPGGDALPFVDWRDSDTVEVGDLVLALGNPFGVGQTVTSGIVSAVAQTRVGISDLNFFIQTDAAINPGNSGGALVDTTGRLIGINTAIYSRTGGSIGIGFAVPSNMVRSVVAGFTGAGRVVRPWLGAWGRQVTSDIAQALGLRRPAGVLVEEVFSGGPADDAGIRVGDVVLAVNGLSVDDPEALDYRIATLPVGGSARLDLWREGDERSVVVSVGPPPEIPPRSEVTIGGANPLAGATVADLSPALAEELGLRRVFSGVVVLEVTSRSPAQRIGLQRGDRVLAVNGAEPASASALNRQMGKRSQRWQLVVGRGEQRFSLVVGG